MSDGAELAVEVAYPLDLETGQRSTEDFPVLLNQGPYLHDGAETGKYFTERGYIYASAHVRGTRDSGGSFGFFSDRDAQDGAELVEWASSSLEGSNGQVGLHGDSYKGLNQMFTLAELGPDSPVEASVASCSGAETYRETYFAGGVPTQTLNFQRVIGESMGPGTAPSGAETVENIEAGGSRAYYGDYWKQRTVGEYADEVVNADVPILLWGSSEDIYAQSSLELYAYLQNSYAGSPTYGPMQANVDATPRYQYIQSQGDHCANQDKGVQLQWFDTWIKGIETRIDSTKMPLHVHEEVSNDWINTSHYPVIADYSELHLDANANETLTDQPSDENDIKLGHSASDNRTVAQFDTGPFTHGATLAGPIAATSSLSSSAEDFMLIADLQVVDENGETTPLVNGTLLGSMAELDDERGWADSSGRVVRPYGAYESRNTVSPGESKRYDFALTPAFTSIPPGSRIRLVLSTQSDADCTLGLGTDACFPTEDQSEDLTDSAVTVHMGGEQPSTINLPLAAANCWVTLGNSSPSTPFWSADPVVKEDTPCQSTQ